MKKLLIVGCLVIFPWVASAQQDSVVPAVEDLLLESLEERMAEVEDAADFSDEVEQLLQYQFQKINLNDMPAEVAYTLLGLSDYQYYQLQLYIEMYGELVTLYELAAVDGFSRADVERIWNRVEVLPARKGRKPFADFFRRSKSTLLLRYGQVLERQAGYESSYRNGYLGSPQHLSFKYSFQSGEHFSLALAGEKDAGEAFFRGGQKQGFEHYSFFVNVKNMGVLKNCVIGDYTLSFGQGLVMGGRSMGSRGGGAAQVRRFPQLLRATAPMNEGDFLRGAAVVLGNAYYTGTIFYSHRFFDGKVSVDEEGTEWFAGSLSPTGYHRTASEVATKGTARNRIYGAHFQLKRRIFEAGATVTNTQFVTAVSPASEPYRKYGFSGKSVCNAAADYKVILYKTILFGEAAVSVCGGRPGLAVLQGAIFDPDPRSKLSVLFRYYDRSYIALQGSGFGAGGGSNEWGAYVAADFVTGRRTALNLFADYYRFPWLRYRVDSPSGGFDFGAVFSVSASKYLSLNLKYRFAQREQNVRLTDYYQSVTSVRKHRFRCAVECSPTGWLQLKTEADYAVNAAASANARNGLLLFQDVAVKVEKWDFAVKARVAFFQTDSYDERLYAYESDLLYTFTVNSYYGKGVRYYLTASYGYAFFDIQLRFSQTYYDDRTIISSGPSQIDGRTKSELKAQVIFHF